MEHHALSIYPSVSNDGFFKVVMENSGKTSLTVFDITGSQVSALESSSSEILLNLSKLKKGIYIVKAIQNNTVYTRKIIIG